MEESLELLKRAREGDKAARDTVVQENLGLVGSVVKRFESSGYGGYDREDLFQIGVVGLIKAVEKFDFTYEVKFSTYAVPLVMGEIRRFLRDDGIVKVSRSIKENGWRVKKSSARLEQSLGRSATLAELAQDTGLTTEEVAMALDAGSEITSIYQTVYQSDGSELYLVDKMADKSESQEQLLNQMVVQQLMCMLEPREQELIRFRYFEGQTQSKVAGQMGMTQVQVSRMEKKILHKMKLLL